MLTIPIKLASLLVLVNGSLLFLAGISAFAQGVGATAPGGFTEVGATRGAEAPAPDRGATAPDTLVVDFAKQGRPVSRFWAQFGYDEPNYTYMKDGRKLLSELAALSPVPVYVRCHNLLTTGDGEAAMKWGSTNAYTEDANGNPVYDWHITDSIFDTYLNRGMKPLAEIGFMPEALSVHPEPYRHHWKPGVKYDSIYTGWAWPPVDYNKWGKLVEQWVRHCVIDEEHSNAFGVWKRMGSPQAVSTGQYIVLEKAGRLEEIGKESGVAVTGGELSVPVSLPAHAVVLLRVSW